jgi:VanZ family protein
MQSQNTQRQAFMSGLWLFGWAFAILVVSSLPGNRIPAIGLWQWDKAAHFFEYAVLAALLFQYCSVRWSVVTPRIWWLCMGIGETFGALDEAHQTLIPFRTCTWQDFTADSAGICAGLFFMYFIGRKAAKK